jgi:hypothetical protein
MRRAAVALAVTVAAIAVAVTAVMAVMEVGFTTAVGMIIPEL